MRTAADWYMVWYIMLLSILLKKPIL